MKPHTAESRMDTSPVTVRLAPEAIDALDGLCVMDEANRAQMLRTAVAWYVDKRLKDPRLPELIDAARARELKALDALENWQSQAE